MSITMFLAFCILGCDFMLYVLFQWIYGEKHRNRTRRLATRRQKGRALSGGAVRDAKVVSFPYQASILRYLTETDPYHAPVYVGGTSRPGSNFDPVLAGTERNLPRGV